LVFTINVVYNLQFQKSTVIPAKAGISALIFYEIFNAEMMNQIGLNNTQEVQSDSVTTFALNNNSVCS
jgi:hypothetical protein